VAIGAGEVAFEQAVRAFVFHHERQMSGNRAAFFLRAVW
jgi:hypothetical protein